MTMNLNTMVAIAGGIALFGVWLTKTKSGLRGFLLMCTGCTLIFLAYEGQAYLNSLAAIAIAGAGAVIALLLFSLSGLVRARRKRGSHYHPPLEMSGMCSNCAQSALLKRYQQGWLCAACASCISAEVA